MYSQPACGAAARPAPRMADARSKGCRARPEGPRASTRHRQLVAVARREDRAEDHPRGAEPADDARQHGCGPPADRVRADRGAVAGPAPRSN